jgi:hypothetical protein
LTAGNTGFSDISFDPRKPTAHGVAAGFRLAEARSKGKLAPGRLQRSISNLVAESRAGEEKI